MSPRELKKLASLHAIDAKGVPLPDLIRGIQRKEGNFDCFATAVGGFCDQDACLWREDCLSASAAAA